MSELADMYKLVTSCKHSKFFPLSTGLKYFKCGKEMRIRRNATEDDFLLNFNKHGLKKLEQLAVCVGARYPCNPTRAEVIEVLEKQMVTRSVFLKQIEEAIQKEKEGEKDIDIIKKKYKELEEEYNSGYSRRDIYDEDAEEELKMSPALYKLLMEKEEEICSLKKKLKRIKRSMASDDECRCGYTSAGSYLGGACRCD